MWQQNREAKSFNFVSVSPTNSQSMSQLKPLNFKFALDLTNQHQWTLQKINLKRLKSSSGKVIFSSIMKK